MTLNEYRELALRTNKEMPHNQAIIHGLSLLINEVGELASPLKAAFVYGKPLDVINVKEELGDIMWAINLLVHTVGGDLDNFVTAPKSAAVSEMDQLLLLSSRIGHLSDAYFMYDDKKQDRFRIFMCACCEELVRRVNGIAEKHGMTLSDVLKANITKLAARYGDKYSDEAALNRNLEAERKSLEG